jgi:hypothetical protein
VAACAASWARAVMPSLVKMWGHVHLDSAGGDEQPLGDGLVLEALAHEQGNLWFGGVRLA